MIVMKWDGSAWASMTLPIPGADFERLNDIAVSGDGTVWGAGTTLNSAHITTGLIMRLTKRGWRVVQLPALGVESILEGAGSDGTDPGGMWAVGLSSDGENAPPISLRR